MSLPLETARSRSPSASTSAKSQPVPHQAPITIDDAWIILYTSGTTGNPKGALLPYRQVAFNAFNTQVALDLTAEDRTVTYTPLFHTGGLHVLTTPMLARGGAIVLCDGFEPSRVLELTRSERCTVLFGVPSLVNSAPPIVTMCFTLQSVSTLLTMVGHM